MPRTTPTVGSPAARLFVPVHRGPCATSLRAFVDPLGNRTGVAFTSLAALHAVLGVGQAYREMAPNALRALLNAAGTQELRIDPRLVAAPPADRGPETPVVSVPRARLRVEGFAA